MQGGEEYWNRLNEIKQPTLIIHGTDDKIWHYKNAGFTRKNKGSNLITLEGTGHELHVDDWKSIIDGIEKHINDCKQKQRPANNVYKNRRNSSKFKAFGSYYTLCLTENLALRNRLLFIY